MRKHQQQKILELLRTIEEAQSAGLYSECQECAQAVGEYIDKLHGEGTETVKLLEQYCDMLCQATNKSDIKIKPLKKQLINITNSTLTELKPDKIEIAFFPYKASMSDSFETIYLAAKADPQCDAYWVPIPYFDKTTSGAFGEMHYEGAEYLDFEITDWRKYDVQSRHPDIVFIHNPYDEFNYVTSVHPNYYSKTLKEYTDLLVYIDYGLLHWIHRDPQKAREKIAEKAHVLPAYVYCDLYVCYSKEFADAIKLILSINKEKTGIKDRRQLDKKIVALGHPKFDKILNSKREHYTLPQEWSDIVAGANKKIVLFNTSIGSALKDSSGYLKTVRSIMNVFKSFDDIVLWWRPHPLLQSTFGSMRPELAKEYQDMVDAYKQGGWGIYDDTSELHRAIAWSDAYYGDESSLIYLICAAGKPLALTTYLLDTMYFTKGTEDFSRALKWQIKNMQQCPGANVHYSNTCVWWHNFSSSKDIESYLKLFLHFVANPEKYEDYELYKSLLVKLFTDFIINPDGTAGQKIYEYCKRKVLSER